MMDVVRLPGMTDAASDLIESFDANRAQCTQEDDRQTLLTVIEAYPGGIAAFNSAAAGMLTGPLHAPVELGRPVRSRRVAPGGAAEEPAARTPAQAAGVAMNHWTMEAAAMLGIVRTEPSAHALGSQRASPGDASDAAQSQAGIATARGPRTAARVRDDDDDDARTATTVIAV